MNKEGKILKDEERREKRKRKAERGQKQKEYKEKIQKEEESMQKDKKETNVRFCTRQTQINLRSNIQ